MAFSLSNVLTTVEVPQLLLEKFGLNTEQLGLDFNFCHWNVAPIVGIAIGTGGNQVVATVLITMRWIVIPKKPLALGCSSSSRLSSKSGASWVPPAASSGVGCALIVGVRVIPTLILHFMGRAWRPAIE
ncbi:hypothetical protein EYZ11_009785 [Aspergillus tanneri]|uniref:Uncharacterized protein n=1 Tax=Aspergillus tanneri TaxID=1220188 RepID=A0A4S3JCE4_9EURO|nr:hypothetical protein EYZ11_009785 [Aspergillus tanneri]